MESKLMEPNEFRTEIKERANMLTFLKTTKTISFYENGELAAVGRPTARTKDEDLIAYLLDKCEPFIKENRYIPN